MRAPQVNLSLHSDYHREVAARAAQNAPSNVVVRPENLLVAAQKSEGMHMPLKAKSRQRMTGENCQNRASFSGSDFLA
jgi:hypothetical protein